jgi:hypothetical protein
MRRFAGILIFAVWLAAVTWFWWQNVPLVPTKSVQIPSDAYVSPIPSPAGELVIMPWGVRANTTIRLGPVQFWKFPEGQIVRSLLTEKDEIIAGSSFTTPTLIRRNGQLEVIDPKTGQSITKLPDRPNANNYRYLAERRQVLIQNGNDLELFDFDAAEPRWIAKGTMIFLGLVTPDLILAHLPDPKGRAGTFDGVGFVSIETGLPDPRFTRMGKAWNIHTSRDGRLAMVYFPNAQRSMYDVETGRHLWTMPLMLPSYRYSFSPDGSEYIAYLGTRTEPRDPIRWRTSDGQELPKLSGEEMRKVLIPKSTNRYFVKSERLDTYRTVKEWIASINRFLSRTGTMISVRLPTTRYSIVDTTSGRAIGVLPDNLDAITLPSDLGFVVPTNGILHYFSMPPDRDYWWLAGWALLPPLSLVAIIKGRKQWRLQRARRCVDQVRGELPRNAQPRPVG